MSDHKGTALIYPMLPDAETPIADNGYDRDAFREVLARRGTRLAFHREPSACPQHTARLGIDSATSSRTCSQGEKTGGASYNNALRPLRSHILRRNLHHGNRYLLARSMRPDPSSSSVGILKSITRSNSFDERRPSDRQKDRRQVHPHPQCNRRPRSVDAASVERPPPQDWK